MAINYNNITIEQRFPTDPEAIHEINKRISKHKLNYWINEYGEEYVDFYLPLWIEAKKLEKQGINIDEAINKVAEEYIKKNN